MNEFPHDFPYLNQVECHPLCNQLELRQFCYDNNIKFQAYSSLGSSAGHGKNQLTEHVLIQKLAQEYSMSVQQVLLLWALQQSPAPVLIIPKSTSLLHLETNLLRPWHSLLQIPKSHIGDKLLEETDQQGKLEDVILSPTVDNHTNNSSYANNNSNTVIKLLSVKDKEQLNNLNSKDKDRDDEYHFCWNPRKVF